MHNDLAKANHVLTDSLYEISLRAGCDGLARIERDLENVHVNLEHEWVSPLVQYVEILITGHHLFVGVHVEETPGHLRLVLTSSGTQDIVRSVAFDIDGPLRAVHNHWQNSFAAVGA